MPHAPVALHHDELYLQSHDPKLTPVFKLLLSGVSALSVERGVAQQSSVVSVSLEGCRLLFRMTGHTRVLFLATKESSVFHIYISLKKSKS